MIIVTGRDPGANRERALRAGAKAFLQKPVNNDELLAVIQRCLGDAQWISGGACLATTVIGHPAAGADPRNFDGRGSASCFSSRTTPRMHRLIRGALADARGGPFEVHWVRKISDGIEFLRTDAVGAIFADLFLPDSRGIETLGPPVGGCASSSHCRHYAVLTTKTSLCEACSVERGIIC